MVIFFFLIIISPGNRNNRKLNLSPNNTTTPIITITIPVITINFPTEPFDNMAANVENILIKLLFRWQRTYTFPIHPYPDLLTQDLPNLPIYFGKVYSPENIPVPE